MLLHVHLKLVEIFGCTYNTAFAGITVIAVGDFMQLPPVKARCVYAEYKKSWKNFVPISKLSKISKLTEIIWQRGRAAKLNQIVLQLLTSKFIDPSKDVYPNNSSDMEIDAPTLQLNWDRRTSRHLENKVECTSHALSQYWLAG